MTTEAPDTSIEATNSRWTEQHQEWLVEAMLLKWDEGEILKTLQPEGYSTEEILREIAALRESATYRAASRVHERDRKLRSLVDALSTQWSRSPLAAKVPVIDHTCSQAFYEHYLFANRPVVIKGLIDDWPALQKWSPEFFARTYGACPVEIMAGRDADTTHDKNLDAHRHTVRMDQFCDYVLNGEGNDRYLVGRNNFMGRQDFGRLLQDLVCPRDYLKPEHMLKGNFWMGPSGTRTRLHHDHCNALFVQIYGSKRLYLIEPHDMPRVYNDGGQFSDVDLDDVDLCRFPKMASVPIAEVIVNPGDTLLIPMGWFHEVKSLTASISISFNKTALPALPARWTWR